MANLPEDQCIFVRGSRVTRKFKILPSRLKGAAGPSPDPEEYDEEPDVELVPIPAVPEYRDPLHTVLDFVAEEALDCDMVLVHDNDLAQLDGIHILEGSPLESFQLATLSNHLRSVKPKIHKISFGPDLLSSNKSASDAPEIVWVATLSPLLDEQCEFFMRGLHRDYYV
ncbi:hypothetical protein EI94DRAFT_567800 [Lactarius quietus]|nr:hypothetical protein EI94DRAFT_567800 [Lactarius quietus]